MRPCGCWRAPVFPAAAPWRPPYAASAGSDVEFCIVGGAQPSGPCVGGWGAAVETEHRWRWSGRPFLAAARPRRWPDSRRVMRALAAVLGLVAARAALGHEEDDSREPITCGSAVKLSHAQTGYLLHSHDIAWGSGSHQQSVTGTGSRDDPNSLWVVAEGHGAPPCRRGGRCATPRAASPAQMPLSRGVLQARPCSAGTRCA